MIIGLFIDLWNYWYTRSRIKLMKNATEIWATNKLKLSILGVLYTIVEIDKSIPDNLVAKAITVKLSIVDDALVAINLDGLIHFESSLYAENNTTRFMLVKFVPNMPHWTWWYFLTSCASAFIIIKLILYFGLWQKMMDFIGPYFDSFLQIFK